MSASTRYKFNFHFYIWGSSPSIYDMADITCPYSYHKLAVPQACSTAVTVVYLQQLWVVSLTRPDVHFVQLDLLQSLLDWLLQKPQLPPEPKIKWCSLQSVQLNWTIVHNHSEFKIYTATWIKRSAHSTTFSPLLLL